MTEADAFREALGAAARELAATVEALRQTEQERDDALKRGEDVPGATLTTTQSLRVR